MDTLCFVQSDIMYHHMLDIFYVFVMPVNSIHNGVYGGKRYFHCPRGHGAFVSYCDVVRINPADIRPPVSGNPMYPNYKDMLKRRKERAKRSGSLSWCLLNRKKKFIVHLNYAFW